MGYKTLFSGRVPGFVCFWNPEIRKHAIMCITPTSGLKLCNTSQSYLSILLFYPMWGNTHSMACFRISVPSGLQKHTKSAKYYSSLPYCHVSSIQPLTFLLKGPWRHGQPGNVARAIFTHRMSWIINCPSLSKNTQNQQKTDHQLLITSVLPCIKHSAAYIPPEGSVEAWPAWKRSQSNIHTLHELNHNKGSSLLKTAHHFRKFCSSATHHFRIAMYQVFSFEVSSDCSQVSSDCSQVSFDCS